MEPKVYSCVKRTKKAFADAFITLAQKQPVSKITVKALCEEAQLSRNAFYSHYEDLDDLQREIQNLLLDEMRARLGHLSSVGFPQNVMEVIQMLLDIVLANRDATKMLLEDPYFGSFTLQIYEIFSEFFYPYFARYNKESSREAFDFYYTFISDGFFGMVRRFLNEANGFPREKFVSLCYTFITRLLVPQTPTLDFLEK